LAAAHTARTGIGHRSFLIATSWNPSAVSALFRALASALEERGHTVQLIVDGHRHVPPGSEGISHVATWPSRRPTHVRDFVFLDELLRERRPDTVIANFGAVNVCLVMAWLRGVPNRLALCHTLEAQNILDHGDGFASRLRRYRKRWVYRLATGLVANSNATAEDLIGGYGVRPERVAVHYLAVADIDPVLHRPRRRNAVCVGRLNASKGQDVLIRALPLVPELAVTFVGGGPQRERLETLASAVGVADRCMFRGPQSRDEVYREMQGAAFTVVPSRAEAFGFVAVESLACGTPVVASETGGLAEIVRDGTDGALATAGDPVSLAQAMRRCLAAGHSMRENARERFLSNFELTKTIRAIIDRLEGMEPRHRISSSKRGRQI
jgi:glycosyltransferase involved in cell wall biosynthesis